MSGKKNPKRGVKQTSAETSVENINPPSAEDLIESAANDLHRLRMRHRKLKKFKREEYGHEDYLIEDFSFKRLINAYDKDAKSLSEKEFAYLAFLLACQMIERLGNHPKNKLTYKVSFTRIKEDIRITQNNHTWVQAGLIPLLNKIEQAMIETKDWRHPPAGFIPPEPYWLTKRRIAACGEILRTGYGEKETSGQTHESLLAAMLASNENIIEEKRANSRWYEGKWFLFRWILRVFGFGYKKDTAYVVYSDTKKILGELQEKPVALKEGGLRNEIWASSLRNIKDDASHLSGRSRLAPVIKKIDSIISELPLRGYVNAAVWAETSNEELDFQIKCKTFEKACLELIKAYYEQIEACCPYLLTGITTISDALSSNHYRALEAWAERVNDSVNSSGERLEEKYRELGREWRKISLKLHPDKNEEGQDLWAATSGAFTDLEKLFKSIEAPDRQLIESELRQFTHTHHRERKNNGIARNNCLLAYLFVRKDFELGKEDNLNKLARVSREKATLKLYRQERITDEEVSSCADAIYCNEAAGVKVEKAKRQVEEERSQREAAEQQAEEERSQREAAERQRETAERQREAAEQAAAEERRKREAAEARLAALEALLVQQAGAQPDNGAAEEAPASPGLGRR